MEGIARPRFTARQRAELWERWKSGQCVADIARGLERRNKSGVYRVLAVNGGIAPAPRRRAALALRLEEREEISRGIAAGRSIRAIAAELDRAPSTVSRELKRHGGRAAYRASEADTGAWERALRPKRCRLPSEFDARRHQALQAQDRELPDDCRDPRGCVPADVTIRPSWLGRLLSVGKNVGRGTGNEIRQ